MPLSKKYYPKEAEPRLQAAWKEAGIYHFSPEDDRPVFSIDTPPPTVSGHLHLGHVFSYSHADFIARFWRMKGYNLFYPMGYDDNGLPTERMVEKLLGIKAAQAGRAAFIEKCLQISEQAEEDYQALWQRLGLSIDWRHTYRTIDDYSRRTSQLSFIDLYRKGLVYRQEAPAIWCPECQTAIAQADLNDLERKGDFVTLAFQMENGETLPIATTRPELLPACVAVFVHPQDTRFRGLAGRQVSVPLFGQRVPVLEDPGADPEKGSGAVMCCTFGDASDVAWWRAHRLPLIEAIGRDGKMTQAAGNFAGLSVPEARRMMIQSLQASELMLASQPVAQSVRVHERCDTPVEYIVTRQWFVRVLDSKQAFLEAGDQVKWHPEHMQARYRAWVENLNWDWCISRQRYFGVPFPAWYCQECSELVLADPDQLPVDPFNQQPRRACQCGSVSFTPDEDVMDVWATSSLSPQIVGRWLEDREPGKNGGDERWLVEEPLFSEPLYARVFPFSLRPQGHEIIRTWAFYTIVKSHYHFGKLPWQQILISGWGIAGEGMGKISKSRGGGPMSPLEMIERYSADAVRYWAASTSPGKDAIISEEKVQIGSKLVTKLWNLARFSEPFLVDVQRHGTALPSRLELLDLSTLGSLPLFTPADRWILSRTQRQIRKATELLENYDYASAKNEVETFFWTEVTDNYVEMCKQRLYDQHHPLRAGALFSLSHLLSTLLKLFAPFLPFVTEEIYQAIFASHEGCDSIHTTLWPQPIAVLENGQAEQLGEVLVGIATAVRRYKSEHSLPLSTELDRLQLATGQPSLADSLKEAVIDLSSITRARQIEVVEQPGEGWAPLQQVGAVWTAINPEI